MKREQLEFFWDSAQTPAPAYIVYAKSGADAAEASEAFCKRVFCLHHSACGKCLPCRKFESGNLLDYLLIEERPSIKDLRKVVRDLLSVTAFEGGMRCVYIKDADVYLDESAQNFFLKILEEPPKGVVFVLSVANKERLLSTIRSRCISIKVPERSFCEIKETLVEGGAEKDRAAFAAAFSEGSLSEAKRILLDETFFLLRDAASSICRRLAEKKNPSIHLIEQEAFLYRNRLNEVVLCMHAYFSDAFHLKSGLSPRQEEETVKILAESFTSAQLGCIIETLSKAYEKKAAVSTLRDDLFLKGLLFDILEVKRWHM